MTAGTRGPKPKPASLHLLHGNPSKIPIKDLLGKVRRPVGLPACPDELSADARIEWDRLGALLVGLGLISHLDLASFALYCEAWGDYLKACRKLKELGDRGYVESTPSGYQQMGPWLSIKNRAADAVNKYKSEFGLSPADWNRVEANPQGDLFNDQGSGGNPGGKIKDPTDYLTR